MEVFNAHITQYGKRAPLHDLCGYIPGRVTDDALSYSILDSKRNLKASTQMWTDFALQAFHELDIGEDDVLIRALTQRETDTSTILEIVNPVAGICRAAEQDLGCRYCPDLIHKSRPTASLKRLDRNARWKEIGDAYSAGESPGPTGFRRIWLIDDIVTTGSTARAIWKALETRWPDIPFHTFALARTTREPGWNEDLEFDGQQVSWRDGGQVVHEPHEHYIKMLTPEDLVSPAFENSDTFIQE